MDNEEKRAEVLQWIQQGASIEDLAGEYSVSPVTIRKWLQAAGIKPPGRRKVIDKMDATELEAFEIDYGDHTMPIYNVCKKYHISVATMYQIVRELGLEMRSATKGQLEGRVAMEKHVCELYEQGEPYWKITETTGVAPAQITTIVRKHGLEMRRPRG